MAHHRYGICLAITICLLGPPVHAEGVQDSAAKRPLAAIKTTTPPTIDGDLADPAWKSASSAQRFYDLQQGTLAPDQTTAYVLYDDRYLYFAFYCHDSQPDQIVARETVRDQKFAGGTDANTEDNVEVTLDPFLSRREEDFATFSVNPLGTRSARITGGRAGKAEWKGDWDAAARRVADGWTCEMRIPWAILNYPTGKKTLTMGINFWRWQDRTKIQSVWSNVGPQRFHEFEGLWTDVQIPQGTPPPRLSVLPYVLPGLDRSRPTLRSGLDARYPITPELTAVGTINPDFGTIEGAVESIQFSRSERFVPERRPFFLEGSDYLQAGEVYNVGLYFYPNRIRTFDLGTKVYGKVTPTDTLGFLHTIDFHNESDVVARYDHKVSDTANVGLFLTQKTARDDDNTVGVLQQGVRWGKFSISSQWGVATGHNAGGAAQLLSGTYNDRNNLTNVNYLYVSPLFRDANGLIPFTGYRGLYFYNDWSAQWRKGYWRSFAFEVFPHLDWHTDGRPFRPGTGLRINFETRSDWRFGFEREYWRFDDQTDSSYTLRVLRGVSNRFRQWGVELTTGRAGGRPSSFIGPTFSVRTLRKLDLAYGGAIQELDGRAQQHILTLNYEVSPTRSFGGRVVIQNADTNWYLSYRRSGEKGTETFFILGDPNARRFARQVRVKYVFAL